MAQPSIILVPDIGRPAPAPGPTFAALLIALAAIISSPTVLCRALRAKARRAAIRSAAMPEGLGVADQRASFAMPRQVPMIARQYGRKKSALVARGFAARRHATSEASSPSVACYAQPRPLRWQPPTGADTTGCSASKAQPGLVRLATVGTRRLPSLPQRMAKGPDWSCLATLCHWVWLAASPRGTPG